LLIRLDLAGAVEAVASFDKTIERVPTARRVAP
jgi:hypothetical protein